MKCTCRSTTSLHSPVCRYWQEQRGNTPKTTHKTVEQLGAVKLTPGEQYRIPWQVPCDSVLDDIRLLNIEGSVDIHYVQIGNVLVAAYSRRPKLIRVHELLYIVLENYGKIGGQCSVEIEYHPVT